MEREKSNRKRYFLLISVLITQVMAFGHPAKFVWKDAEGKGRQQKVLFRNSFELEDLASELYIHLFADSRYHIYVNGIHLNFGPSRFYPAHPEYDSYKLTDYLKKGKNVIAVEVLANGMESFQIPASIGGFIAWGSISEGKSAQPNLETPGRWKMFSAASMDSLAVKFSFACAALENQDLNNEPFDWTLSQFDDSEWSSPITIKDQNHWGHLTPRTIPPLTQNEITPFSCLGIYPEQQDEFIYSFYEKSADETMALYNSGQHMLGYTYIYSPTDQDIELGTWWGDYYLNGEGPIPVSTDDRDNPVRENRIFQLRKGWNYLFIYYRAIWGAWEFTLAVPSGSGILLAVDKKTGSPIMFKTLAPLSLEQAQELTNKFKSDEKELLKSYEKFDWENHSQADMIRNPARELVWNPPDLTTDYMNNDYQTTDFETSEPRYYVFDMGNKTLGRLFIDIESGAGTMIEMGWSEDLNMNHLPYLYKREQINSGARFITNGKQDRYTTFKPYGVRYIIAKISPTKGQLAKIKKLGVMEQVYPYEKTGSFECSDPMFNKIWALGWRTLRVCSEDSYIDTPFRERGLYAGDALPEYAITLATSGDSRLMKRSLMLFQDMYHEEIISGTENRHNDFILKTLVELYWYYKYTNDYDFTQKLYANYRTYLLHVENRIVPEGYYRAGQVFFEWTKISKTADLTAYQALLYGSFRIMQELATDFGFSDDAGVYAEKARELKNAVNRLFWDEDKQAFFDGYENGQRINHHYPISSFYPLLFDLADSEERNQQIIRYLEKELRNIGEDSRDRKTTPYASFYLFAALYQNGEAALAERFMKQYWSRMIHQGDDTSWENFDIGEGQGTASHAWSGHPTYFMSTEILGVKVGFNQNFSRDTIVIQPQTENVTWAKGVVPHPAGLVKVDWYIRGDNLILDLELPADVPYVVEPRGKLARLNLIVNARSKYLQENHN